ncbi:MAG: hypothetical protein WBP16_10665 [Ferruginibacter sp.]
MRNRKTWLIIKGVLIIVFALIIIAYPTQDDFRKWLRFGMLVYFVVSFILDLNRFRKKDD